VRRNPRYPLAGRARSLRPSPSPRPRRPLSSPPPDRHTGTAVAKFRDERYILPRDCPRHHAPATCLPSPRRGRADHGGGGQRLGTRYGVLERQALWPVPASPQPQIYERDVARTALATAHEARRSSRCVASPPTRRQAPRSHGRLGCRAGRDATDRLCRNGAPLGSGHRRRARRRGQATSPRTPRSCASRHDVPLALLPYYERGATALATGVAVAAAKKVEMTETIPSIPQSTRTPSAPLRSSGTLSNSTRLRLRRPAWRPELVTAGQQQDAVRRPPAPTATGNSERFYRARPRRRKSGYSWFRNPLAS
jgi:hypothetical protein